jgi:undecaprenyl-diphosphatase
MDIIQAIALAILQGLTEFLPISSSAHLILLPLLLGWQDQGLAFDVAVHVGTLTAVVVFYRQDLLTIIHAWINSVTGKGINEDAKLGAYVLIGTIPVGLVGISLSEQMEIALRSPIVIAMATLIFALLLGFSEKKATEKRHTITLFDALLVGLFQALALIPGTSRSGITLTAGLLTGLKREQAARFSFLLSIPVIALAGMLKSWELYYSAVTVNWGLMAIGASLSALVAYFSITWFLTFLNKVGMLPFVYYRLVLGLVLLGLFINI